MISNEPSNTDVFDGLQVIDCDAHFTEPPDLWSARVARASTSRVPQQRTVDGITAWYLDDALWASVGGNTIRQGREKVRGAHVMQPFDAIDPAAWNVSERLGLMDDMGIHAQVLYPNGIGFASNHVFAIPDLAQRVVVLQTYNDFLLDTQEASGGRLFPQGLLPIWDMDLTVREMARLLDRGMRGFTISDKPEMLGLPELHEPYFAPMWDTFNESGAVANFHIGSGARREEMEALRTTATTTQDDERSSSSDRPTPTAVKPSWSGFGPQRTRAVMSTQMYMSNVRIVVNLCMSAMFDRYPSLKIVSAESGIGWVPFILEALEYQLDEMVTDAPEVAFQQRRPTEYFRDHLYVMFWFEEAGTKVIEDIGVENVLIETDVPHPTCLYPGAREHFTRVMRNLDAHARRRVLQDNAAELYKIPLTAT